MTVNVAGCKGEWSSTADSNLVGVKGERYEDVIAERTCRDFCERDAECTSVSYTYAGDSKGCWVYRNQFNESQLGPENGTNHHFLVSRSGKVVGNCIPGYDGKHEDNLKHIRPDDPIV